MIGRSLEEQLWWIGTFLFSSRGKQDELNLSLYLPTFFLNSIAAPALLLFYCNSIKAPQGEGWWGGGLHLISPRLLTIFM